MSTEVKKSKVVVSTPTIEIKKFGGDNTSGKGTFRVADVASAKIELRMNDGTLRVVEIADIVEFSGTVVYKPSASKTIAKHASAVWTKLSDIFS